MSAEQAQDLHISSDSHSSPSVPDWEMGTQEWVAVLGAALGAFMAVLDIQITNASLRLGDHHGR